MSLLVLLVVAVITVGSRIAAVALLPPPRGRIYAQYLEENHLDATAPLFQNDDHGMDYLDGFKDAIEGTNIEIIAEQSYETSDPTVESQMTNLAQSGADVFFNITTPSFAAQAMGFDAQPTGTRSTCSTAPATR